MFNTVKFKTIPTIFKISVKSEGGNVTLHNNRILSFAENR